MYQTSHLTFGRSLSNLKAIVSVKSVYSLAFALLLASGMLVVFPPTSTLAATCSATCAGGQTITVTGASSCSCIDYSGCAWTIDGHNWSSNCATTVGYDDPMPIPEEGPVN